MVSLALSRCAAVPFPLPMNQDDQEAIVLRAFPSRRSVRSRSIAVLRGCDYALEVSLEVLKGGETVVVCLKEVEWEVESRGAGWRKAR